MITKERLKELIAEKEKEIEELRDEIARRKYAENTTDYWVRKNIKKKEIRHQVCDEIRTKARLLYHYQNNNGEKETVLTQTELFDVLQQIEKGE